MIVQLAVVCLTIIIIVWVGGEGLGGGQFSNV